MAWQDMVVPVDPGPAQPTVNLGGGVTSPATAAPETPAVPTVTVRPAKPTLAPDVLTKKAVDLGYAPGGAAGITQNILRESGGDPTQIGDSGTSAGLFQHHNERRAALEEFAKAQGKPADDPDVQFQFADQEMKRDYPKLRAKLMDPATTPAEAEQLFRTIFERPKAGSGPGGAASIDAPNFKWSDYALKQYAGRPDTDVVWMKPSDYLDLTPDLGDTPRTSKQYRELQASLAKGEPIEEIPSLEVSTGPSGAKVTDQDGRHRALAAQEAGIDLIPVAVKYPAAGKPSGLEAVGMGPTGKPKITELEGMTGKLLPFDFQPYATPQKAAEGGAAPADGMLLSGVKGAAAGFGRTVLGAQQLVGKGLEAVSDFVDPQTGIASVVRKELGSDPKRSNLAGRAGEWLVGDAEKGISNLKAEMAPDVAAHPIASEVGDLLGSSVVPGGVAGKVGGGIMRMGAVAGGVSGLLEPVRPDSNFTLQKLAQTGLGAGAGAVLAKGGELAARAVGPAIATVAGWVKDVKGPDAVQSAAVQAILRRMAQDVKGGSPSAQEMLDLLNANPDKPLSIADVGGPNVRALLGAIARQPGEAQTILKNFHVARDLDARLRVNRDINENIGAGSTYSAAAALEGARARLAAPLYQEAFAANQQMESPLLDKIIRTPAGQKAMRQAVAKMQNDMTLVAKPDPELTALAKEVADLGLMEPHGSGVGVGRGLKLRTWDYVKRSLDDQIGVAQRAGERDEARILTGLKKTMVDEMDRLDVTARHDPVEHIAQTMASGPNSKWGIRVVEDAGTLKPGDPIPKSRVWDDGKPTNKTLPGSSTVGINGTDKASIEAALKQAGINGSPATGYYPGRDVILVRGDSWRKGYDVGERIISNPTVASRYTKAADPHGPLESHEGAYARGRAVYSGHSRSLDALEEGRKFANKLPEEIEADLKDMAPGDREFYRMGVAEKLRLEVGKGGNEAANAVRNQNMTDRLRAVLGDDAKVEKFLRAIDAEKTMFRTDKTIFGNSATAERQAEDRSAENEAASHAIHAAVRFHLGDPIGAISRGVRALSALRGAKNPEMQAAIARLFAQPAIRGMGQGVGPDVLRRLAQHNPTAAMRLNTVSRPMSLLLGPAAQQGTQPMIPQ